MHSTANFITDFGQPMEATNEDGELAFTIERYGVWVYNHPRQKHQVVETGSDLAALQEKYGPCEVYLLSQLNGAQPDGPNFG